MANGDQARNGARLSARATSAVTLGISAIGVAAVVAAIATFEMPDASLGRLWLLAVPALVVLVALTAFFVGRDSVRSTGKVASPEAPATRAGGDDLFIRRDLEGRIVETNEALARRLGRPDGAFDGWSFAAFAADLKSGALLDPSDLEPADRSRAHPRIDPWKALRRRLLAMTLCREGRDATLSPIAGLWGDMRLETVVGPRWYAWSEEPVNDHGSVVGIRSLGRDITDRKAIEAALEVARDDAEAASQAKSRFLAMVSHEIRTPLNGILGMTDLLGGTMLTAEQRTYARAIDTSGRALLALIEDVLDFSKIEAGRLDLSPEPVDLPTLVEETIELLAPRAQGKGIELASYVDPRLPEKVTADPARLRQVLINLAGNGIKFTGEGGVAVELIAAGRPAPAGSVSIRFQVRDTGIGISADDQRRIFEEFEQADPGPARSFGGTGLGLAIARELVRLMGGDIDVDSAPGAGACFAFTLAFALEAEEEAPQSSPETDDTTDAPTRTAADAIVDGSGDGDAIGARAALARLEASFARPADPVPMAVGPTAAATPPTRELDGRRVLVVSEAIIEAPLILRRLFDAGADVTLAGGSEIEADLSTGWRPDAILVDAAVGDALSLADRIRAVSDVPMAVLLLPSERPRLAEWQQAGYAAYLIKPVRSRSLVAVVRALVEGAGLDTAETPPPEEAPPSPAAAPLDVLLCDDNEINLLLGRALLEKLGHRVSVADGGRKADELVAARLAAGKAAFDVVLMDLHMPEVDGAEATRRIRARFESLPASVSRTRVVALTADALPETRSRYENGLFDDWLAKPLQKGDLQRMLARSVALADVS